MNKVKNIVANQALMTWIRSGVKLTLSLLLAFAALNAQVSESYSECELKLQELTPPHPLVSSHPWPFAPLTSQELFCDWAKELKIGTAFAKEQDLYRAITSFKRALILIPADNEEQFMRRIESEYSLLLCYYYGHKYEETVEIFNNSHLPYLHESDPLYHDLLVILYDCYDKLKTPEYCSKLLDSLEVIDRNTAHKLQLASLVLKGDLAATLELEHIPDYLPAFIEEWHKQLKSPKKAGLYNALLPGAGYWYVGQKNTAITSFLLNTLFITAAYQFFHHGYVAAGVLTSSLELGWYCGGISGAVLSAKEHNRALYCEYSEKLMAQEKLFPLLMLNYSF